MSVDAIVNTQFPQGYTVLFGPGVRGGLKAGPHPRPRGGRACRVLVGEGPAGR